MPLIHTHFLTITLALAITSLPLTFSKPLPTPESKGGSFTVQADQFLLNGHPFRMLAGEIHYHRTPPALWEDRLLRVRELGTNAIQAYVPWNFHERTQGDVDFTSPERDLPTFLATAQRLGMLAVLRIGPYICGEWDFGGLPAWLLENGTVPLRTSNGPFMSHVRHFWTNYLLPLVKPLLITNGGNVVMVQVENEFGSYADVRASAEHRIYLQQLIALARAALGDSIVLFTTDGADGGAAERGSLPGGEVLTVVDGCLNPTAAYKAQRKMNPEGMASFWCSEFYTGWLTHWSEAEQQRSSSSLATQLSRLLQVKNASVSLYMAHGGTNFGFWAGANGDDKNYLVDITSYDYNAPIREDGRHGTGSNNQDKFVAVQRILQRYNTKHHSSTPLALPVIVAYGRVLMDSSLELLQHTPAFATSAAVYEKLPPSLEVKPLRCYYGFAVYATPITKTGTLRVGKLRDRAIVVVDGKRVAVVTRKTSANGVEISVEQGSTLHVVVENLGRINFGHGMDDERKGILEDIVLNSKALRNWNVSCLDFHNMDPAEVLPKKWLPYRSMFPSPTLPMLFKGRLTIHPGGVADTYVFMAGWGRGVVWVNGRNLGRFSELEAPQRTLYCPRVFLREGANTVVVFELYPQSSASREIEFVSRPIWRKPALRLDIYLRDPDDLAVTT